MNAITIINKYIDAIISIGIHTGQKHHHQDILITFAAFKMHRSIVITTGQLPNLMVMSLFCIF